MEAQGVYANNRQATLKDFVRTCGDKVDTTPFVKLFDAWDNWETGVPSIEETAALAEGIAEAARKLRDVLGPDESEAAFSSWPPRTI